MTCINIFENLSTENSRNFPIKKGLNLEVNKSETNFNSSSDNLAKSNNFFNNKNIEMSNNEDMVTETIKNSGNIGPDIVLSYRKPSGFYLENSKYPDSEGKNNRNITAGRNNKNYKIAKTKILYCDSDINKNLGYDSVNSSHASENVDNTLVDNNYFSNNNDKSGKDVKMQTITSINNVKISCDNNAEKLNSGILNNKSVSNSFTIKPTLNSDFASRTLTTQISPLSTKQTIFSNSALTVATIPSDSPSTVATIPGYTASTVATIPSDSPSKVATIPAYTASTVATIPSDSPSKVATIPAYTASTVATIPSYTSSTKPTSVLNSEPFSVVSKNKLNNNSVSSPCFNCPVCEESFKSKRTFNAHILVHCQLDNCPSSNKRPSSEFRSNSNKKNSHILQDKKVEIELKSDDNERPLDLSCKKDRVNTIGYLPPTFTFPAKSQSEKDFSTDHWPVKKFFEAKNSSRNNINGSRASSRSPLIYSSPRATEFSTSRKTSAPSENICIYEDACTANSILSENIFSSLRPKPVSFNEYNGQSTELRSYNTARSTFSNNYGYSSNDSTPHTVPVISSQNSNESGSPENLPSFKRKKISSDCSGSTEERENIFNEIEENRENFKRSYSYENEDRLAFEDPTPNQQVSMKDLKVYADDDSIPMIYSVNVYAEQVFISRIFGLNMETGDMIELYKCCLCDVAFHSISKLQSHLIFHKQKFECIKCDFVCETRVEFSRHVQDEHFKQEIYQSVQDRTISTDICSAENTITVATLLAALHRNSAANAPVNSGNSNINLANSTDDAISSVNSVKSAFSRVPNVKISDAISAINSYETEQPQPLYISEPNASEIENYKSVGLYDSKIETRNIESDYFEQKKKFPQLANFTTHSENSFPPSESVPSQQKFNMPSSELLTATFPQDFTQSQEETFQEFLPEYSKEFQRKNGIKKVKNLLTVHEKDYYKTYSCRFCEKKFDRAFSCNRHERVHTGYKPCFCKICGRGFSEPRNLRHHVIRFHSDGSMRHLIKRERRKNYEKSIENTEWTLNAENVLQAESECKVFPVSGVESKNLQNNDGSHIKQDDENVSKCSSEFCLENSEQNSDECDDREVKLESFSQKDLNREIIGSPPPLVKNPTNWRVDRSEAVKLENISSVSEIPAVNSFLDRPGFLEAKYLLPQSDSLPKFVKNTSYSNDTKNITRSVDTAGTFALNSSNAQFSKNFGRPYMDQDNLINEESDLNVHKEEIRSSSPKRETFAHNTNKFIPSPERTNILENAKLCSDKNILDDPPMVFNRRLSVPNSFQNNFSIDFTRCTSVPSSISSNHVLPVFISENCCEKSNQLKNLKFDQCQNNSTNFLELRNKTSAESNSNSVNFTEAFANKSNMSHFSVSMIGDDSSSREASKIDFKTQEVREILKLRNDVTFDSLLEGKKDSKSQNIEPSLQAHVSESLLNVQENEKVLKTRQNRPVLEPLKMDCKLEPSREPSSETAESEQHSPHFSAYAPRLNLVNKPVNRKIAVRPSTDVVGRTFFKCLYCRKTFYSPSDLNRHLDFHEDYRPHECQYCDYSARTNSQLKVHQMRHEGVRHYKCLVCRYNGVTQSDLNRHKKTQTHFNRTRNICEKCGVGFFLISQKQVHVEKCHSESGEI